MNQNLQKISEFLQQNESLSAEEKSSLSKAVMDADKEMEITAFKLDRTEKVKRTTAILLEETIEELEQKRKAVEAQNRELEIEASLERVRSSAMAMRSSDELNIIIGKVFTECIKLDIQLDRGMIMIFDPESLDSWWWMANPEAPDLPRSFHVPYNIYKPYLEHLNGWKERTVMWKYVLEGKEKKDWDAYIFVNSELSMLPVEVKQVMMGFRKVYLNASFNNFGCLILASLDLLSDDHFNILLRFAKVFDLTYTRFNDLKQAEAQAREAQIELALERVRARTMSMQKSEELADVALVLFQQVKQLGIETWTTGFNVWLEGNTSYIDWVVSTNEGRFLTPYTVDLTVHPFFMEISKARKRGDDFFVIGAGGETLAEHYRLLFEMAKIQFEDLLNAGFQLPKHQINHYVFGKQVSLMFITFEPCPEAHDIFKRLGKVFEQTYTRFLDLQKAEAQAREAQIESALERIRARSMSMQRSNELAEAAQLLYQQFHSLGIKTYTCAYMFIEEEKNRQRGWAVASDGTLLPDFFDFPLTGDTILDQRFVSWKNKQTIHEAMIQGEANKQHHTFLVSMQPPEFAQHIVAHLPDQVFFYNANFLHGYLFIVNTEPFTPEEKDIAIRFAKVFEQTYTRFLDLQKAEAQAREAQIETALERVRSRTMAMHNSQDVGDTVDTMFDEFVKLGIETNRCGILIFSNTMFAEVWTAKSNPDGKATLIIGQLDLSVHPLLIGINNAWKKKEQVFTYPMLGDDLTAYYQAINDTKYYPTLFNMEALPSREFHSDFYFAEGSIFAFTAEPIPSEAALIFKRFSGVFGQTYRRYLDLQKAEAQAREATIEAALERVRSRTLAMQKSDELAETAAVVFRQLINLGIAPNRLYIAIIKDQSGDLEFWITDEDGTKVSTQFTGNKANNTTIQKMYEGWEKHKKSISIDLHGKELSEYFHYLSEELKVPFKLGLSQKRRVQNLAYFSKGFIGIASPDEQPDETIRLLERFAAVFNLTFTRFNDLKIAEAHAEQAELDLIKLKEEKKRTEDALTELKATQSQLIQSEKMASLGELTAGIAHEIQNPLNFVNNFSEVSTELVDEMNDEIDKGNIGLAKEIASDLRQNLEKINHHGKRAGDIVKGMLQHSRTNSGTKEPTDINKLADEYLRLAYHGLRAKDKSFNATMKTDFDETIGNINIIPQDIGRVILNLITNAFYAVNEKNASTSSAAQKYEPIVTVSTISSKSPSGDLGVKISVKDNGNGIPQKVLDKIFQPFFTTKPTGQGTGLGLSLAYDIVKAHGGELNVETKEREGTEFIIQISEM